MKIKILIIVCIIILISISFIVYFLFFKSEKNKPTIYFIPHGYVGWVKVYYGQDGYPPLPIQDNYLVYQIPGTGILKTSTQEPQYGWSTVNYYYIDSNGNKTELLPNINYFAHSQGRKDGQPLVEKFFVGTKEQFNETQGQK
jgi:hypothetical protein